MLPSYFDYIFVHLRQKARLRSELSPKFFSTLGPNPVRTRPEKPGPTYNSAGITYDIKTQVFKIKQRIYKSDRSVVEWIVSTTEMVDSSSISGRVKPSK